MPYIFAGLAIINVVTLVYFTVLHTPAPTQEFVDAKAELTQPIEFENSSDQIPAVIGKKN